MCAHLLVFQHRYCPRLLHMSTSTPPIPTVRPRPYPIPTFVKLFQCPYTDSVLSAALYAVLSWFRESCTEPPSQGEWALCPCISVSYFGVFNGLVISLPNIAYPNFFFGSQRHRSAFCSPVLHPILNAIHSAFFFFFIPLLHLLCTASQKLTLSLSS